MSVIDCGCGLFYSRVRILYLNLSQVRYKMMYNYIWNMTCVCVCACCRIIGLIKVKYENNGMLLCAAVVCVCVGVLT